MIWLPPFIVLLAFILLGAILPININAMNKLQYFIFCVGYLLSFVLCISVVDSLMLRFKRDWVLIGFGSKGMMEADEK